MADDSDCDAGTAIPVAIGRVAFFDRQPASAGDQQSGTTGNRTNRGQHAEVCDRQREEITGTADTLLGILCGVGRRLSNRRLTPFLLATFGSLPSPILSRLTIPRI